MNPLEAHDTAGSHGVLTNVIWAALFGDMGWRLGDPHRTWVLFAAVLSHWLVDLIAHRPDIALALDTSRSSTPAEYAIAAVRWGRPRQTSKPAYLVGIADKVNPEFVAFAETLGARAFSVI